MTIEQLQNLVGKTYFNRYLITAVDLEHNNVSDKYSFTFLDKFTNEFITSSFSSLPKENIKIIFYNRIYTMSVFEEVDFYTPKNSTLMNYIIEEI